MSDMTLMRLAIVYRNPDKSFAWMGDKRGRLLIFADRKSAEASYKRRKLLPPAEIITVILEESHERANRGK